MNIAHSILVKPMLRAHIVADVSSMLLLKVELLIEVNICGTFLWV